MGVDSYDADLVAAAISGEPAALSRLVSACAPDVLRLCNRLAGSRAVPEDAAQDALIIVCTRIRRLRRPERFDEWIYGIVRRVLAQHRRRAWLRRWVPGAKVVQVSEAAGPDDELDRRRTARRVRALVDRLPETQRVAVREIALEGCSSREVAERHAVPRPTVRRSKQRGEAKLRAWVSDDPALVEAVHPGEETP